MLKKGNNHIVFLHLPSDSVHLPLYILGDIEALKVMNFMSNYINIHMYVVGLVENSMPILTNVHNFVSVKNSDIVFSPISII